MLKLRPYKKGDAFHITTWLDSEESFIRWCANRYDTFPLSNVQMEEYHEKKQEDDNFFAMTAIDESGIVGYLAMEFLDEKRSELLFSCIIVNHGKRGRGYGKEMLTLALCYAFRVLKVKRVVIRVFENNVAAIKCYQALGFEKTQKEPEIFKCALGEWKRLELEMKGNDKEGNLNSGAVIRDMVTGLYNFKGFAECLTKNKEDGIYQDKKLLLLCIDIDGLEHINNLYGRSEGDLAIVNLAKMMDVSLGNRQICGHLGGNEFGVAFAVEKGEEERVSEQFIYTVRGLLDTYNQVSGKEYSVVINYEYFSRSIEEDTNMQVILEEALRSKRISKDDKDIPNSKSHMSKEYFHPDEEMLIKSILDSNNFDYAFQPIIDAKTAEIYAYEALMRTKNGPKVSPLTILMYADMHDRLYDIEKATMFNAMEKIHRNQEALGDRKVFVNSIPGHQLSDADYEKVREKYSHLFKYLVMEVTEQTELHDDALRVILERSSEDSFGIAIDDFGTGYSNTSSLLRYLPNCVKIDKLLITNIQEEPKKQHFVKSIIEFCHDNGILVLAEGVETHGELKAVINMGVDLIQGFYTAKPSLKVTQDVDDKIKNEILSARMSAENHTTRKIYMVDKSGEIPLMRLALEEYTGLLIADQDVTLVGNPDYRAGFTVKVKDGAKAKLTIRNVFLEGAQDLPCIDIGKGAELTLVLEGENALYNLGIRVPEDSFLKMEGAGNLIIYANGVNCYGIGNIQEAGVGSVYATMSGALDIHVDGTRCCGIGGGIYRQGKGIRIYGGSVNVEVAGENAVGIGCMNGDIPIDISHCRLMIDFKVYSGSAIGTVSGIQNIRLSSVFLNIAGSGSQLCGIGSPNKSAGLITVQSGKVIESLNGQNVKLIGSAGGGLIFEAQASGLQLTSEGSKVTALGCDDASAKIHTKNVTFNINVHAGDYQLFGAKEENMELVGGERSVHINED